MERNNYRISFGDLEIGYITKKNIQKIFDTNWVSEGKLVKEFEREFAKKFSYKHAIAMSSGTDADTCTCASLYDIMDAQRGDDVIVPACCFVACANSILAAGLKPVFVDISLNDSNFLNIDPSKIEEAITEKTKAIMVVHTMGKPCKMQEILEIANKYGLKVLEDCCESHSAQYKGKYVGTIGEMGCFSFYTAHQIVTGEGGMVVTNDDKIADIIRSVKSHGRPANSIFFDFQRVGFNSKSNEFAAALGLEGLENFDDHFNKRKENLYKLLELTKDLEEYCHFIIEDKDIEIISPHAFPLVIKKEYQTIETKIKNTRDDLYKYLEENGIQCKTLFGSLPTQHNAFKFLKYKYGDFPIAEYVGNNGLHFGCHQYMTNDDLHFISDTLHEYFRE